MSELISIDDFLKNNYIKRLATFEHWKFSHIICPKDLASAGFCHYYKDIVICRECNLVLFKWNKNEEAIQEHKKFSISCKFIKLFSDYNIKISDDIVIDTWVSSNVIYQYHQLNVHTLPEIRNGLRIRLNTKYKNFQNLKEVFEFFKHLYPSVKTTEINGYNPLTCRICLLNPTNIVFINCGHMLSCHDCARKITICPLCRSTIKVNQRIFY